MDKSLSIIEILVAAGKAIVEVYNSNSFDAELKSDNSPVTKADKASSEIINSRLKKLFPALPVLDEENRIPEYNVRKNWSEFFLVDPLDGTKEFIKRNGEFCINIAFMNGSSPQAGWIYEPLAEKGWYCYKGNGIVEFDSKGNTKTLHRPGKNTGSIRVVASRSFFKPREAQIIEKMSEIWPLEIIHCGSSKKQVQMLVGNADMYLKAGPCSEWDTAPGQLMIEEFGGGVFRQDNFERMYYNKPKMLNPHFIMLNEQWNQQEFIRALEKIIAQ